MTTWRYFPQQPPLPVNYMCNSSNTRLTTMVYFGNSFQRYSSHCQEWHFPDFPRGKETGILARQTCAEAYYLATYRCNCWGTALLALELLFHFCSYSFHFFLFTESSLLLLCQQTLKPLSFLVLWFSHCHRALVANTRDSLTNHRDLTLALFLNRKRNLTAWRKETSDGVSEVTKKKLSVRIRDEVKKKQHGEKGHNG